MMPGQRLQWRITRRCSGRAGQRAICMSCAQLIVGGVPPPAAELHGLGSPDITERQHGRIAARRRSYGNDWDSAEEVAAWAEEADRIRPWRAAIRDHIARRVATLPPGARVLELGSGPGFLAHRVLQRCPSLEGYTLLDFSEPMLALSQERLAIV